MKYWSIAFLALASCTSMQVIKSQSSASPEFKNYDAESKVRYAIGRVDESIIVRLSTNDQTSIMKIMNGGLTIHFNTEGKKKSEFGIQYPIPGRMAPPVEAFGSDQSLASPSLDRSRMRDNQKLPPIAKFISPDSTQQLNIEESDISIEAHNDEYGEFFYTLKVPKHKIGFDKSGAEVKYTIGIETGEIELPALEGRPNGNMPAPGGGMGGPGGMNNSGGGMGGPGRMGGMDQMGGPLSDINTDPIEIWMTIVL